MNQEQALKAVAFLSFEEIFVKVEYLFRWSDVEVNHVVSKALYVMRVSKDLLQVCSSGRISSSPRWGWNQHTFLIGQQCSVIK